MTSFVKVVKVSVCCFVFFFNDTATTEIYTLSLHDALPICYIGCGEPRARCEVSRGTVNKEGDAMHRLMTTVLLGAAFVLPVLAQEGGIPPVLVDHWKTSKKYVLALAEQMPADGYAFKPNPAEMSFGEQMAHIAGTNSSFFATLSGQKDPIAKPTKFDK